MSDYNIGQQLKAARKSSGKSIEQLADTLRLSPQKLELLEKNKFSELAAPTYVAGYIRSYCEELDLDPEKLLNEYHENNSSNEPQLSSTSNQPKQINAKHPMFITMTIAVLLFLLALIGTWAWESFKLEEKMIAEVVPPLPEIEAVFDNTVATDEVLSANFDTGANADFEATKLEEVSTTEAVPDESLVDSPVEEAINLTELEVAPVNESFRETVAEKKRQDVVVQQNGQAPKGSDNVIINVSSQSWVNIKDANGYRLYYDMLTPAKSPLTMRGQAPFEIVLGDASVVGLSINNTIYDVKRHMRTDKSARFKLQ